MDLTRKQFLKVTAGAAALAAVSSAGVVASCTSAAANRPKRGVSLYSYTDEWGVTMLMEDCFKELQDMDAQGLEILANSHIEGYPNPTDEWCESFKAMCAKYNVVPVEYGHWVDSRLHKGRELTSQESYDMLIKDIKLANKLGFTVMRTKLGVIDETLTPVTNWQEFIQMALPDAEKYNVKMCPEIHNPTLLKSKMIDDYVAFIEKTKTKNFGLNIDFGVFQNKSLPMTPEQEKQMQEMMGSGGRRAELNFSKPEEIVPLLPYVYCCHAKFNAMNDDCTDATIPYDQVIPLLIQNKWDGYLLSEYEGRDRGVIGATSNAIRKQHVMLKRLLGEA
jgi:hypothetical protein